MVIKKGDYFECIKGKQYRSDQDDCITNESGDINHYWNNF